MKKIKKIYVDGSCIPNPGIAEYRGIMENTEIFRVNMGYGTNNHAEFCAIVHAIAYCKQVGIKKAIIYTDSQTAKIWIEKGYANSRLNNPILVRAEDYIRNNDISDFKIEKWDTRIKGEIPADFGRKGRSNTSR